METGHERPITLGDWLDLRDEMRATELLLEDVQLPPTGIASYWEISADLLALLQEIDEHLEHWRTYGPGDDESGLHLKMRRRLVNVLAKAEELGLTATEDEEP